MQFDLKPPRGRNAPEVRVGRQQKGNTQINNSSEWAEMGEKRAESSVSAGWR